MLNELTTQENEILKSISKGFSYREIAIEIGVPATAIKSCLKEVYRKLGVRNSAEAAVKYLKVSKMKED
jgi:DNA-binding NarL/FixJ family response regulator